jgi:hypothetical protein
VTLSGRIQLIDGNNPHRGIDAIALPLLRLDDGVSEQCQSGTRLKRLRNTFPETRDLSAEGRPTQTEIAFELTALDEAIAIRRTPRGNICLERLHESADQGECSGAAERSYPLDQQTLSGLVQGQAYF